MLLSFTFYHYISHFYQSKLLALFHRFSKHSSRFPKFLFAWTYYQTRWCWSTVPLNTWWYLNFENTYKVCINSLYWLQNSFFTFTLNSAQNCQSTMCQVPNMFEIINKKKEKRKKREEKGEINFIYYWKRALVRKFPTTIANWTSLVHFCFLAGLSKVTAADRGTYRRFADRRAINSR